MLIDTFTVIAQIINFLILVWLLKRYLYKPILKALDEREKKISFELSEGVKMKAEAQKERDEFQYRNDLFDNEVKDLKTKVTKEVAAEKGKLLEDLRKESESIRSKYMESLLVEHQSLNQEINREIQEEVFAIARKTLSELADTNLEESIVQVFIKRLNTLEDIEKEKLISAVASSDSDILIISAFKLSSQSITVIELAVNNLLAAELAFGYETAPDIISGVELVVGGYKLSWSISKYVSELENNLENLIDGKV
ncbi:MAG: F0F1 ATP synthase subunit B [Lentisphaerota bacterium]